MRFKFGDIIENGWAGDTNPIKRTIFIKFKTRRGRMNGGKFFCSMEIGGRSCEHFFDDHRMRVIGTIFQCGDIAELRALLARRDAPATGEGQQ